MNRRNECFSKSYGEGGEGRGRVLFVLWLNQNNYQNFKIFKSCNLCLSVSWFVCPITTQEPLTDLPHIFIGELGRATEMFFACLEILSRVGRL